jgi:hypothetical protein
LSGLERKPVGCNSIMRRTCQNQILDNHRVLKAIASKDEAVWQAGNTSEPEVSVLR